MRIVQVNADRREEWDKILHKEPYFALQQSWAWGEFKRNSGWSVFRVAAEDQGCFVAGAQMLIKPLASRLASVAYIPRGPFGNWLDNEVGLKLMMELHRLAKLHNAIFLKIEPAILNCSVNRDVVRGLGFKPSSLANQPTATIIVDLNLDLDEILGQMRKRTREYIRYSERKGVTVRSGTLSDLTAFARLMNVTAKRERFIPRTRAYYSNEWETFNKLGQTILLMASYGDRLLAVHMAYRYGDYAAYFHGGSSGEFAELRPNYLLVCEAIKWAKAQGCLSYDLWGIPDEIGQLVSQGLEAPVSERSDELWGVYRFKRGFSKNIVGYVGSWDYIYKPFAYVLITNRLINVASMDAFSAFVDSLRYDISSNAKLKSSLSSRFS